MDETANMKQKSSEPKSQKLNIKKSNFAHNKIQKKSYKNDIQ